VNICAREERLQVLAMRRGFDEAISGSGSSRIPSGIFILSFYPEHCGYLVEREGAISRVITLGD
jgi:hypothetical protein